jgi:hypothetical protein
MELKPCCESYLHTVTPKTHGHGKFSEIHVCAKCRNKLKITFEERRDPGSETSRSIQFLGAESLQVKKVPA